MFRSPLIISDDPISKMGSRVSSLLYATRRSNADRICGSDFVKIVRQWGKYIMEEIAFAVHVVIRNNTNGREGRGAAFNFYARSPSNNRANHSLFVVLVVHAWTIQSIRVYLPFLYILTSFGLSKLSSAGQFWLKIENAQMALFRHLLVSWTTASSTPLH